MKIGSLIYGHWTAIAGVAGNSQQERLAMLTEVAQLAGVSGQLLEGIAGQPLAVGIELTASRNGWSKANKNGRFNSYSRSG